MEAEKLFHWFIAVYLPTIGAHNHMGLILEALFLPTFFCNGWSSHTQEDVQEKTTRRIASWPEGQPKGYRSDAVERFQP